MTPNAHAAIYSDRFSHQHSRTCQKCGIRFKEGEKIQLRRKGKAYHESCWEEMFI